MLRIEDTDQKRKVEASEEYIFESLAWAGISPDESALIQGHLDPIDKVSAGIFIKYTSLNFLKRKVHTMLLTRRRRLAEARLRQKKQQELLNTITQIGHHLIIRLNLSRRRNPE